MFRLCTILAISAVALAAPKPAPKPWFGYSAPMYSASVISAPVMSQSSMVSYIAPVRSYVAPMTYSATKYYTPYTPYTPPYTPYIPYPSYNPYTPFTPYSPPMYSGGPVPFNMIY